MKDIHSHLLFGIDDGSKSIDESILLLKEMKKHGLEELILTPHYVEGSRYNCNNKNKLKLFEELKQRVKEENIDVKLYLGNEVYITTKFIELIKNDEIRTLNNSKYLLFEFPLRHVYKNTSEIISDLVSNGYIPVLAHPERYEIFEHHPDMLEEYLRKGVLMQGNLTSLFNVYGRTARKTLEYFLKNKWITFLGSDTHHKVQFDSKKLEKKLLKITKDPEYVEDLLNNNFNKIINNEDIGMIR